MQVKSDQIQVPQEQEIHMCQITNVLWFGVRIICPDNSPSYICTEEYQKSSHQAASSWSAALMGKSQTEEALSTQGLAPPCHLSYPRSPERDVCVTFPTGTAKEALSHQSRENALKMKSATY